MSQEQLIDLEKKQLGLLQKIIKQHIPDKTVWAYGSRVNWKANERSDLDLTVFGCESMEIYALKEALEESNLLISVDVMNWEEIPDNFRTNIKKKYVVLQAKQELEGWREVRLGDVATLNYGKSLPERKRISENIPVYSSAGITGWHNKALIKSKGIIIGRKGTIGSVYKSQTPFFPIDTVFYISNKDTDCNLDFLFYMLSNMKLYNLNSDSAVPGLNRNTAYAQEISLPPLPEQKAIAEVLSSLDDKIDLLHRQNKTLEDMAQTLFRQWFIEEAEESWESGKLGDILTVKGGTTPSTKNLEYWNGAIHWTTPKDLSNNCPMFLMNTLRKITQKGLDKIGSGLLPKGTLLLSSRAPVGYMAFSAVPIAINQGYIAIIDDKKYSKLFIYFWLKFNMDYVKSFANGSTFQEISKTAFKSLEIVMPPKDKRDKFDETTKVLFEKTFSNQQQISTLESLRDTLLPKLMSGEVRIN